METETGSRVMEMVLSRCSHRKEPGAGDGSGPPSLKNKLPPLKYLIVGCCVLFSCSCLTPQGLDCPCLQAFGPRGTSQSLRQPLCPTLTSKHPW